MAYLVHKYEGMIVKSEKLCDLYSITGCLNPSEKDSQFCYLHNKMKDDLAKKKFKTHVVLKGRVSTMNNSADI